MKYKNLKRRVIEISKKHNLSHIGSCLTMIDILAKIYEKKGCRDVVVVSNGHAGLAQYVCLEAYNGKNADDLYRKHGVHPNYELADGIYASTGSLGHGIGIAVGYALADRTRTVYVTMSDGELAEGSVYESLQIASAQKLENLEIHINANGYGAYRRIYPYKIAEMTCIFGNLDVKIHHTEFEFPFLEGLDAHYMTLNDEQYQLALDMTL